MHLDRLVILLETVATAGRPLSVLEVQQATGLPRPTCYRLLQTMTEHGLLDDRAKNSRYVLGDRLIRTVLQGTSDIDVRQAAAPIMKDAATEFGEAVFLSRFRNAKVEIIHVEIPADPKRSYYHPGLGNRPIHACSCSKVIAAFAEKEFQDAILSGPMRAYTEHTKVTEEALRQEFADILVRGYGECVEEIEVGISSVAAPVQIPHIGAIFSIGATGSIRRFSENYRKKIGSELINLSSKIATSIQLSNREGLIQGD
ncbi:MAG: IclR family acetate operon transcriptional repressor [Cellvibrionaceae bacterium]|jgi:IclR family acetate operon transcriptional repressor